MKTIIKENISVKSAVLLAQKALKIAEEMGHNVCATVVDASGVTVAVLKGDHANQMTPSSSFKKAYTAAATKNHTLLFADGAIDNPILTQLTHANESCFIYGGGVPIYNGDNLVGALGIAGAPGGNLDDKIATKAIEQLK